MNKKIKILAILMIIVFFLAILSNITLAKVNIDHIKDNDTSVGGGDQIKTIGSYIYTAITNVGIVAAVVVVAILGVKYMLGSADERAEYKKSMMPYLIGALLVFGASGIAKAVVAIAK